VYWMPGDGARLLLVTAERLHLLLQVPIHALMITGAFMITGLRIRVFIFDMDRDPEF
jgi:hypothetical protein